MKKLLKVAIITVSDKGYREEREDRSGKYIMKYFKEKGWEIADYGIVPDEKDKIKEKLKDISDKEKANLILTTGGTGFSPRDVTPKRLMRLLRKRSPGLVR